MNNLKFAVREAKTAVEYLKAHPEVTDILITGGDPLIMPAKILEKYVDEFLNAYLPHIRTIRFGSRTLTYWPYRFLSDKDSEDLLGLFKKIKFAGKHVAFMASFVHPNELKTDEARLAIERILETGAQIRTQAPILRQVNDDWRTWEGLWRDQVNLGCVPYYMFVARDTGPRDYFALPLIESWRIFKQAYQSVSGICRTVRGPSMSADPGKLQILGSAVIRGENVLVMQFLQARNPEWVMRPFFAAFDEKAIWLDELKPAFGEDRFFYESEGSRHKGKNQYEYGDSKMRRTRVINAGVIHALNIGETMNRYDDLSYICLSD
jgi:L-lysine 2,3-aminomutase